MKQKSINFKLIILLMTILLSILTCTTDFTQGSDGSNNGSNTDSSRLSSTVDYYVFSGDILLDKNDPNDRVLIENLSDPDSSFIDSGQSRGTKLYSTKIWPNSNVKYYFDIGSHFTSNEIYNIKSVMSEIERACGVKFYDVGSGGNYVYKIVRINPPGDNPYLSGRSTLGYVKNARYEFIDNMSSTILHELMHGLGFLHEQQRIDRDNFVTINWYNIRSGDRDQFEKYLFTDLLTPYDYNSIMHYSRRQCAINPNYDTITPKDSSVKNLGGGDLTNYDKQALVKLYGGPRPRFGVTLNIYDNSVPARTQTIRYFDVYKSNVLGIDTPATIVVGDPRYYTQTLYFSHWELSGNAKIDSITSNSTSVREFYTDVTISASYSESVEPGIGTPLSPSGSLTLGSSLQFKWTKPANADGSLIRIYKWNKSTYVLMRTINNISGSTYNYQYMSDFTENGHYAWSVQGYIGNSYGLESSLLSFYFPESGDDDDDDDDVTVFSVSGNPPLFTWPSDGINDFWLLVCDKSDFDNGGGTLYINEEDLTTNIYKSSKTFPPGTYYWKVKYRKGSFSNWYWSDIRSFTIQ